MHHLSDVGVFALVSCFLPVAPAAASFQDATARTETVEERLAQIESRLGQLEKRVDEALAFVRVEKPDVAPGPETGVAERLDALDQKIRIVQRLGERRHRQGPPRF